MTLITAKACSNRCKLFYARFRDRRLGAPPKVDHFMHLHVKQSFKTGNTYTIKLAKGLIPEKYPQEIDFSIDKTPNPSFKLNQFGYSNGSGVKLVIFHLSS